MMSEYAFEGEVVKLNQKDFDKWLIKYPSLNLTQELDQIDEEFSIRAREGSPVKKWFSEAYARLNGRNKIAERSRPAISKAHNAIPRGGVTQAELTDRSWYK